MNQIVNDALNSINKGEIAFCKFISANDAGKTGAHQEGFYIPKNSYSLAFDNPGVKGENKENFVKIRWQSDFETTSRFIYYGSGTRNEYRLTRFGKGFPFLTENNVGDLLILIKIASDYFEGFVLQSDEEFEDFFASVGITSQETNQLIPKKITVTAEEKLMSCFTAYLKSLTTDFPSTFDLANNSRNCYIKSHQITDVIVKDNPDKELLNWVFSEYQLFKIIENDRYNEIIGTPFPSVEELVNCANTILNRRKSRAGKSLEHHLSEVFRICNIAFESQGKTEANKQPDFIFPNIESYRNIQFDDTKLIFLASKTTCKDRWRQILNEADRIKDKHLFTLQQGISSNQLKEMYDYGVQLVVPAPYIKSFPENFKERILSLDKFISLVKSKQS
ncbi:MAG: restriction endonuclease [Odoribacter sp.]|nr:restriction endonuclease [Odoribacter sp.]